MLGRLSETIAIEIEDGQGADDEVPPIFREIGRMRAGVKPVRASESEREGALREVQVYIFTVLTSALRAMPVTSTDHRIKWNGRAYNVREVRTPIARDPFTDIVAEAGVSD